MTAEDALAVQTRSRVLLRDRTTAMVLNVWRGLPSYNEDQIGAFLARVIPVVEAGQQTTALTTAQYVTSVIAEITGEAAAPAAVGKAAGLRGVDPRDVYRRPFVEVYTGLKNGMSLDAAVGVGADRLQRLVDDDLSLAHRRGGLMVIDRDDRVTGYRRVIRPELAAGGTCGLCIAAATAVYTRGNLLPVHSRCGCEVMPIVRTGRGVSDPANSINDADLAALYRGAGSTKAAGLKNTRYAVHEHGELGPVLRRAGDDFTGPSDLAA